MFGVQDLKKAVVRNEASKTVYVVRSRQLAVLSFLFFILKGMKTILKGSEEWGIMTGPMQSFYIEEDLKCTVLHHSTNEKYGPEKGIISSSLVQHTNLLFEK